jgi:hypothetical protein
MPLTDPAFWSDRVRQVFEHYDESLLRQVATRLYKPRNYWPLHDLLERCVATLANAAVIDRRLKDLEPVDRKLLAFVAHSRQMRWKVGNLLELLAVVGHAEGIRPVLALFEAGLLYPDLLSESSALGNFEQWLGQAGTTGLTVFAHPHVAARALGEDLGLPECPGAVREAGSVLESDGLEWLLRLTVLWQQVAANPLRLTQQGDFFKRDLDHLRNEPLLNAPGTETGAELPDAGLLTVALAQAEGVVQAADGELRAAGLPTAWDNGLFGVLESLWSSLPLVETWNPVQGWHDRRAAANPFPSAYLVALLLLARLPGDAWTRPAVVAEWVRGHHPYWERKGETGLPAFLIGVAFPLRLVQIAKDSAGEWLLRLSPVGRWLVGLGSPPPPPLVYPKTLLVQANLEIVAYRHGLTPTLIAALSQIASWKSLGGACLLRLQPETVYRALEAGWTFEAVLQTLEKHGMRPPPAAVVEALRTWANKRERLTIYAAAALFEFASAADLDEALARGLPGVRLSERLAVVANEDQVNYKHFRLTGTRDYGSPPDQCVEVEADGVTLTIDTARSDLLLETELLRFAQLLDRPGPNGRRQYRITPTSVAAGREAGVPVQVMEDWFVQRTGRPLPPAARLLLAGPQIPPLELRRQLVLYVSAPEVADGLLQWPNTRALIQGRLGPTALLVEEEQIESLRQRLRQLGLDFQA